jgi:hypothetical protein
MTLQKPGPGPGFFCLQAVATTNRRIQRSAVQFFTKRNAGSGWPGNEVTGPLTLLRENLLHHPTMEIG